MLLDYCGFVSESKDVVFGASSELLKGRRLSAQDHFFLSARLPEAFTTKHSGQSDNHIIEVQTHKMELTLSQNLEERG